MFSEFSSITPKCVNPLRNSTEQVEQIQLKDLVSNILLDFTNVVPFTGNIVMIQTENITLNSLCTLNKMAVVCFYLLQLKLAAGHGISHANIK